MESVKHFVISNLNFKKLGLYQRLKSKKKIVEIVFYWVLKAKLRCCFAPNLHEVNVNTALQQKTEYIKLNMPIPAKELLNWFSFFDYLTQLSSKSCIDRLYQ